MVVGVAMLAVGGIVSVAAGAYAARTGAPGGRWFQVLVAATVVQAVVIAVPAVPLARTLVIVALVGHYVAWTAVGLRVADVAERYWPAAGVAAAVPPAVVGGSFLAPGAAGPAGAGLLAGAALTFVLVAAVARPLVAAVRAGAVPGVVAGGLVAAGLFPVVPDVLLALEQFYGAVAAVWGVSSLGVAAGLAAAAAGDRLPAGSRRWPGYAALAAGLVALVSGVALVGWGVTVDATGLAAVGVFLVLLFGLLVGAVGSALTALGGVAVRRRWIRTPAVLAGGAVGTEVSIVVWILQAGGETEGGPVPGLVLWALPFVGLVGGTLWWLRLRGAGASAGTEADEGPDGTDDGRRRPEDV